MDKPTILFEDNHVIVAVKKPNQLTQSDATGDESLLDQIKAYVKETYNKPGEAYIGLCTGWTVPWAACWSLPAPARQLPACPNRCAFMN